MIYYFNGEEYGRTWNLLYILFNNTSRFFIKLKSLERHRREQEFFLGRKILWSKINLNKKNADESISDSEKQLYNYIVSLESKLNKIKRSYNALFN